MAKLIGTESKTVIKNIIISVVTTVAGAFAVYFLGIKDSGKKISKLEVEDRTIEAWKTLVTVENIYTKNSTTLIRDAMQQGNFKDAADQSELESKKFQNSLQGIIDTEGIDSDLKSLVQRRLENERTHLPLNRRFYLMLDEVVERAVEEDWSEEKSLDTLNARINSFAEQTKGAMDRSLNDIESLAKILSDRYDHPFSMDDFLIVQIYRNKKDPFSILEDQNNRPPKGDDGTPGGTGSLGSLINGSKPEDYFPGTWDANGAKIFFERNGKMRWVVADNSSEASGNWSYRDSRLKMKVTNPQTGKEVEWDFNLAGVEANYFSMVLTKEPYNYYRLIRK